MIAYRLLGFRALKLKLDEGTDERDIARIRRIAGAGIDLRADVNMGWDVARALEMMPACARHGITSFEQAAFYSLVFVLLNMPFVIVTGYIAWQERYNGAKTTIFGVKIGGTIVVCATLVAMVIWRLVEPGVAASPGRWTYLLICLVCVAGAGISGHFGGKLVFGSRKH